MYVRTVSTETEDQLNIETLQLEKAALVFHAINHPLRQQILRLLHSQKRTQWP